MVNVTGVTAEDKVAGVFGENTSDTDAAGVGVHGKSRGAGVFGESRSWHGVAGLSQSATGGAGVYGQGLSGNFGVLGESTTGAGVEGRSQSGPAVLGRGNLAGHFEGNVVVTGDLILAGADVAEQFDVSDQVDRANEIVPGTVVTLDDNGALAPCARMYDMRVAGVISGAGDRVPALVLDRHRHEGIDGGWRQAIAVVGKVWCRADASERPIQVGNLLTTSSTPGHAMAAVDRGASFGAVLGKALTPLTSGVGLVLVLVGLA